MRTGRLRVIRPGNRLSMSISLTQTPKLQLRGDAEIAQLGFGVLQVSPKQTFEVTSRALAPGHRHIDTFVRP